MISGGLFTLCDGIVQYHLGGTRNTALKLSPTVLIFDTVRRWAMKTAHILFILAAVSAGSRLII